MTRVVNKKSKLFLSCSVQWCNYKYQAWPFTVFLADSLDSSYTDLLKPKSMFAIYLYYVGDLCFRGNVTQIIHYENEISAAKASDLAVFCYTSGVLGN